jgi:hypothetical protein
MIRSVLVVGMLAAIIVVAGLVIVLNEKIGGCQDAMDARGKARDERLDLRIRMQDPSPHPRIYLTIKGYNLQKFFFLFFSQYHYNKNRN